MLRGGGILAGLGSVPVIEGMRAYCGNSLRSGAMRCQHESAILLKSCEDLSVALIGMQAGRLTDLPCNVKY